MSVVAGAVLAAGSGTRLGTPKGTLELGGARLVDRAVGVLRDGGCDPVLAVVRTDVHVPGVRTLINPNPDRGMRSSLRLATDAAAGADGLAMLLADMPGVGPDAVRATLQAWRPGRVAVATYHGRRGHPILMAPDQWRAAVKIAGPDEGARRWLAGNPELVDEVAVAGDPADLDTPDDLRRWTDGTARFVALISGRVQGVGFRYWVRARAMELALHGSATNLPDGRVEVIAEGPRIACEHLLAALRSDATPGMVLTVGATWQPPAGAEGNFAVR